MDTVLCGALWARGQCFWVASSNRAHDVQLRLQIPPKRFHFQYDSIFILVFLIDNRKEKEIL